ncbi:MAG: hypothetical protein ACYDBB_16435 [Armatimonadota bacterium]
MTEHSSPVHGNRQGMSRPVKIVIFTGVFLLVSLYIMALSRSKPYQVITTSRGDTIQYARHVVLTSFDYAEHFTFYAGPNTSRKPLIEDIVESSDILAAPAVTLLYEDANLRAYHVALTANNEYAFLFWKRLPSGETSAEDVDVLGQLKQPQRYAFLLPMARALALEEGFCWKTVTFGPLLIYHGDSEMIRLARLYAQGKDRPEHPTLGPRKDMREWAQTWGKEMMRKHPKAFRRSSHQP